MNQHVPLGASFAISGLSGGIAEFITNPLDFAKVRKQLNASEVGSTSICELVQERGVGVLFKGSLIGVQRQVLFNTIRIGLVAPIQKVLFYNKPITFSRRVLSAMITGAIAVSIISPLDAIRIQLQAKNDSTPLLQVIKSNSLTALYKGFMPNLIKSTIASGVQLSSYAHLKQKLTRHFKPNTLYPHILSSLLSGLLVSVVIHPIDFTRTRQMTSSNTPRGIIRHLHQSVRSEGLLAIYKGFTPNLLRICSWQLVCFYSIEKLSSLYTSITSKRK